MRLSPQLGFLALFLAASAYPSALHAQQRGAPFAGLRPNLVFIDNRDLGFQLTAYLGQPFSANLAGLVEFGVTTVSDRPAYGNCGFAACPVSLPSETAISLATGFQLYASAGAQTAAVTLTPGAVWIVTHPAGTRPVVPKLGGHCEVGWLLNRGPSVSVGFSFGFEWWGSSGVLPRWVVPFELTLGLG